jgi:hypothetical protein
MALMLINVTQNFIGLSTDTKPTTGVKAGSSFIETDTGDHYLFDGSAWHPGLLKSLEE